MTAIKRTYDEVVDAMAEAAVTVHWDGRWSDTFDMTPEQVAEAREGHKAAVRDDMSEALGALEALGFVRIDPEGEWVDNGSEAPSCD